MARFKVGDTIKDTNPRCTHYGAIGKIIKIDTGKTTFVVTNKGDKYRRGDKLTKTNWQLEKEAEKKSPYVKIKALPDGKPMVVQTPMDSLMHSILSDTTRIKRNQAVLDSIRSGKLDSKVYNARIKKERLKKEGEVNMSTEQEKQAFEKDGIAVSAAIALTAAGVYGVGKIVSKIFRKKPGQIMNRVKAKQFRGIAKQMKNTGSITTNIPKMANVKQMNSLMDTGLSAEAAAKAAYPNATPDELASYVYNYKSKKKRGRLYVDKVVLKKAELLQKAAKSINLDKIAQGRGMHPSYNDPVGAGLGIYEQGGMVSGGSKSPASIPTSTPAKTVGTFSGGGTKLPNQVGAVSPTGGGGH